MHSLKVYEATSSQMINLNKSSVFFSNNVHPEEVTRTCSKLGSIKVVNQDKYLGLPMVVTKSKEQVFGCIKECLGKRIQNWKNGLLSPTGKEIVLKLVAIALPTYTMSTFRLSKKLCKEMSRMMANFW
ncbi:hypothetical protein ACH5RR_014719 [Cinchona calisaya]|uniref:Reverse transcriptase n=1 Tax=Cinchona calisaya TaxID=153742 RepID=A0ABD2ZR25_9GENT